MTLRSGLDRRGECERLHCFRFVDRPRPALKAHMSTIVRIAVIVYLTQAAVGIAVGLTLPWLKFFKVI